MGLLMAGQVLLFRLSGAQGDVERAREALSEAERLARANPLAPRAVRPFRKNNCPKIECFQRRNRHFWDDLNFGTT